MHQLSYHASGFEVFLATSTEQHEILKRSFVPHVVKSLAEPLFAQLFA
jgi:hypothetical protein